MTRWITFTFAIAAVTLAASSTVLRSHPHGLPIGTMPSLAELQAAIGSNLPVQEMADLSLVFPLEPKQ